MNINLNVSDENLHRSLFFISDVKRTQIARTIRHNSKGIIRREALLDLDGKYSHENFIHWNDHFQQQFFLTNEATIFRKLKTESLYIWLKAKDIAVSVLTVCIIFQFGKNFPKLFVYLGLVINGASWRQLLQNFDPITGTRMYNQLLKLIKERREQKKMIEEKESLKESVSLKKACLDFKTKKICLDFKNKKGMISSSRPKKRKNLEFKIENIEKL